MPTAGGSARARRCVRVAETLDARFAPAASPAARLASARSALHGADEAAAARQIEAEDDDLTAVRRRSSSPTLRPWALSCPARLAVLTRRPPAPPAQALAMSLSDAAPVAPQAAAAGSVAAADEEADIAMARPLLCCAAQPHPR